MYANGIKIKWRYATEYVPIDFDRLDLADEIFDTFEWRPQERIWYEYRTSCKYTFDSEGTTTVELIYTPEANEHMDFDDAYWGKSRIVIPAGATEGTVTWEDAHNTSFNGPAKWFRVDKSLFKTKTKVATTITQRQQAKFKAALLSCGPSCALTGERTVAALEAAHIISSMDGGNEVIQNGLLLRADIHRLLDARAITLSPDGVVIVSTSVSQEYKKLLVGARLDAKSLRRVAKSLAIALERATSTR